MGISVKHINSIITYWRDINEFLSFLKKTVKKIYGILILAFRSKSVLF